MNMTQKLNNTSDYNSNIPHFHIIGTLNRYLDREFSSTKPVVLSQLLVYLIKILKAYELDFNDNMKNVILALPNDHEICLAGILGHCMYHKCKTCLIVKEKYPSLWKHWSSNSKLKRYLSPFRTEFNLSPSPEIKPNLISTSSECQPSEYRSPEHQPFHTTKRHSKIKSIIKRDQILKSPLSQNKRLKSPTIQDQQSQSHIPQSKRLKSPHNYGNSPIQNDRSNLPIQNYNNSPVQNHGNSSVQNNHSDLPIQLFNSISNSYDTFYEY